MSTGGSAQPTSFGLSPGWWSGTGAGQGRAATSRGQAPAARQALLHADTVPPDGYDQLVLGALARRGVDMRWQGTYRRREPAIELSKVVRSVSSTSVATLGGGGDASAGVPAAASSGRREHGVGHVGARAVAELALAVGAGRGVAVRVVLRALPAAGHLLLHQAPVDVGEGLGGRAIVELHGLGVARAGAAAGG